MNDIPFDDITYLSLNAFRKPIANVRWYLNRYCNYECSYCWPLSHQKEKDFLKKEEYLITIHEIIKQLTDNGFPNINWGFGGGEVTFNPSFLDILNEIQLYCSDENKMTTNLITNLSQSIKWWDEFIKNTEKFYMTMINASLHNEYINTEEKRILFRDKLIHLRNSGVKTKVNIVLLPGNFENTKRDVDFFNEKDIFVNVKSCRENRKIVEGYTKEELEFIKEGNGYTKQNNDQNMYLKDKNDNEYNLRSTEQLLVSNFISYKDWNCTAGFQSVTIHKDGTVYRGTACRKDEILGHIKTGFSLHKKVEKCIQEQVCDCVADLKMPKWK